MDVGSACVDIRPSPKTDVLVIIIITQSIFLVNVGQPVVALISKRCVAESPS